MKILLGCILFLPILSLGQLREFNFYIERKDSIVTLHLASMETFPCLGYSIRTFEMWDHDTLVIDIRGFIKPLKCYSVVDVAKKSQRIIGLRSKQFALRIRWKEKEDRWLIDATTESVTTKEQSVSFTSWFRD
ncbi:MAG: hypothetical protein Q8L88_08360 [Bacteroidota bacterium]|nr:hypothetical protein [Bacteroidota bacterium]